MPAPSSAGAVVFRMTSRGPQLLVLHGHSAWGFPMGVVDGDENAMDAARREVWLDTGIADLDYPFGDEHKDTLPESEGKIERYFLAETESEKVALTLSSDPGRPAHDAWRWVGFEEAEDYLPPRLAVILEWAKDAIARK